MVQVTPMHCGDRLRRATLPPSSITVSVAPWASMPSPPLRAATFEPTCHVPEVRTRPVLSLARNELPLIVPLQFVVHDVMPVPL